MSDTPHASAEPAIRAEALESLLIERGLLTADAVDEVIELYNERVGPMNGARVVARAWLDPDYRSRLLADGTAAIAELGLGGAQTEKLVVVENSDGVHNLVVCTLCSCYPWAVLGLPPRWYKDPAYRSRAVREPRALLREFGLEFRRRRRSGCGTRVPRCATWCCRSVPPAPIPWTRPRWPPG
jgi:nitrile hydratase subunit alpha